MNSDDYLDGLKIKLPTTGNFQAFYNLSSGEKNLLGTNADFIYNLKFPTGEHTKQVTINGNLTGVIESRLLPGFSIGETDMPVTHEGYFSGVDLVQVGLGFDHTGWSAVLDITPNLCDYSSENNLSRVLLSTMDSYNSVSGFHVGINQANRLYLQCNEADKISYATLNKEVNKNSIINISQNENDLSIGVYDIEEEKLDNKIISFSGFARSDKMYLGNFLNNTNPDYTGYEGYINNFALLDAAYSINNSNHLCRCMFSTGTESFVTSYQIVSPNVTGFTEVTGYATGITGYVEQYRQMTDKDGETFYSSFQSGVTGLINLGLQTVWQTGAPIVASHNIHTTGATYDNDKYGLYNRYYLNFDGGIRSGETIEILSFSEPRHDVNLSLDINGKVNALSGIRLYNYGLYRQNKTDPSLYAGRLNLTPHETVHLDGDDHVYDYVVNSDNTLSGFITDEQNIVYDTVGNNSICIDFSGHYETHKIRTGSVGAYFPTTEQFLSNELNDKGQVIITGISGEQVHDGYQIYYNGQKLIEGIDYLTGNTQYKYNNNTYNIDALIITGGTPGFDAPKDYFHNGEWFGNYNAIINTPNSVYTPQMCFVPKVSGEQPSSLVKSVVGCSVPPYCSDPQYLNKTTCEAIGTCSNTSFTNKTTCEQNGYDWTQTNDWIDMHESKALCEASGGIWEADGMDGIPDPLSGFNEMIWVNGVRQIRNQSYKLGRECSLSKSFTFFGENPFIFYNNNEEFINFG